MSTELLGKQQKNPPSFPNLKGGVVDRQWLNFHEAQQLFLVLCHLSPHHNHKTTTALSCIFTDISLQSIDPRSR